MADNSNCSTNWFRHTNVVREDVNALRALVVTLGGLAFIHFLVNLLQSILPTAHTKRTAREDNEPRIPVACYIVGLFQSCVGCVGLWGQLNVNTALIYLWFQITIVSTYFVGIICVLGLFYLFGRICSSENYIRDILCAIIICFNLVVEVLLNVYGHKYAFGDEAANMDECYTTFQDGAEVGFNLAVDIANDVTNGAVDDMANDIID